MDVPKISEERKAERREQILAAARSCFAENGYEGATVARLEEASGLSRGAIFNYFANKEELFLALAELDAERLGRLWIERGFAEALRAVLAEEPAWLGVYFEVGRRLRTDEEFRERFKGRAPEVERQLERSLRDAQERGELRDDVELATLARFMGIVADGFALRVAAGFDTPDAEELIGLAVAAIRPRAPARTRARRSAAAR